MTSCAYDDEGVRPARSQLALLANEFADLHNLRTQARADMKKLNKKLQELESRLFAKLQSASISELQIRDELVLKPRERHDLVVVRTKKK